MMQASAVDTRTPEHKAAGASRMAAFLDELGEPWKATYGRMKARRYEQHTLPVERWEGEGGR